MSANDIFHNVDPDRLLYLALPSNLRDVLMNEVDFRRILLGFQGRIIFLDSEKGTPRVHRLRRCVSTVGYQQQ
jgi:hypothetical protein